MRLRALLLVSLVFLVSTGVGCIEEYFDPPEHPFVEVRIMDDPYHWKVLSDRSAPRTLEVERRYYSPALVVKESATGSYVGFVPHLPDSYRLYVGPMLLYRVTPQEIVSIFGTDEDEMYPGYVYDISEDHKFLSYVPYKRKEPVEGPWQIVIRDLTDTSERTYQIPQEYREVGDAKFSPDGRSVAFAAVLGTKTPEQGGVFVLDLPSGDIEQKIWTEDGFFHVSGWADGQVDFTHEKVTVPDRFLQDTDESSVIVDN